MADAEGLTVDTMNFLLHGDPVKRSLLALQTARKGGDGIIDWAASRQLIKSGAKVVSKEFVEQAAIPLVVAYDGYDAATSRKGEKLNTLVRDGASSTAMIVTGHAISGAAADAALASELAGTGAVIAEGGMIAAGAALLVPIAVGGAAGGAVWLMQRDMKMTDALHAHESRLAAIKVDTKGQSNLQEQARTLDRVIRAKKEELKQHGAQATSGDLIRVKDSAGHDTDVIDLKNTANQKVLSAYLADQRQQTVAIIAHNESIDVLPEGVRNADKRNLYFLNTETKAQLDAATSELRTMEIGAAFPEVKPGNQIDTLPQNVRNSSDSHIYTYAIKQGRSSIDVQEGRPQPSREVLDTYQRTKGPVVEVLHKDVHGKKVAYAANVYNIIDLNDPVKSYQQSMSAMMEPVAGAYAAPLSTPPKPKSKEAHIQNSATPSH